MSKRKLVYLDAAANTPVDKNVFKAMKPFLTKRKGNSLGIHEEGIHNYLAIEEARSKSAKVLGIDPEDLYFTSGATESNNWVIMSLALHELTKPVKDRRTKILVSATEHSSVLEPCKFLETIGFDVKYLLPTKAGKITVSSVKEYIDNKTLLVCVMSINNETGVYNEVGRLATVAHRYKAWFLCDCTQRISVSTPKIGYALLTLAKVDYITFSGHKIGGPTGIGCLAKRPVAPLYSYLHGGDQESGLRGGTHNVAGIIGISKALENLDRCYNHNMYYRSLYSVIFTKLNLNINLFNNKNGTTIHLNGAPYYGNIYNINLDSLGINDIASVLSLRGIEVSTGAACHQGSEEPAPSHVLLAMGLTEQEINRSIRVSVYHGTQLSDIDTLFTVLQNLYDERKQA